MRKTEAKVDPPKPAIASGYLPTLDGWRAIAVCMVILCHVPHAGVPRGYLLGEIGSFGVDLFFAISGFLICTRLLDEERAEGRFSVKGFYVRRAFRIFPASVFYLAVVALLAFLGVTPLSWAGWWGALAFFRNYQVLAGVDVFRAWPTAHFWSLAVEEHFYLLLPTLLLLFRHRRKTVLGLAMAISLAWLGYSVLHTPPSERIGWMMRTDFRISALIFPAILAILFASQPARDYGRRFIRPGSAVAVVFLVVVARVILHRAAFHALYAGSATLQSMNEEELLHLVIGPFLFPFLILATTFHPGALISRFLELRFMRLVGRLSYGIYLWQQLFITPHFNAGSALARVQDNFPGLLLLILIAAGSFLFLERPLIRFGRRFTHSTPPGRSQTTDASRTFQLAA